MREPLSANRARPRSENFWARFTPTFTGLPPAKSKSMVTLSLRHDDTETLDTKSIDRALLPNPL